jgi:hypothetical protein
LIRRRNPFSTCYTAPGRLPFLLPSESSCAATLFAELHECWLPRGRRGAIVGPHGTGKSTLVAALEQEWAARYSYQVTKLTLNNGQRHLPSELWAIALTEQSLVIIDGYEQLGWLARRRLSHLLTRTNGGLLVTTHQACRLPSLYQVDPCYKTLLAVVRRLLAPIQDPYGNERFIARHLAQAWQATGGNARETLFRLYDCWEQELCSLRNIANDSDRGAASDCRPSAVLSNGAQAGALSAGD